MDTPMAPVARPGWLDRLGAAEAALFAPLATDWVVGRAAQSLDGYIATVSGHSRWIGGPADILHTHRLRSLCDSVVVGAGTVRADDPLLTTRACEGPSPVRVVIDRHRRLPPTHRVFCDGRPTLLVTAAATQATCAHGTAEILALPLGADGGFAPSAILAALAARGLTRTLIEGGGHTVSRFLDAGVLDRLHVTIAPVLLGGGIPAFVQPCAADPRAGRHLRWTVHPLGCDILLDIALAG